MADVSSVKMIALKGGAAEDYKQFKEGGGKRKRHTRRQKKQEGGFDEPDLKGRIDMRRVNISSAMALGGAANPMPVKLGGGGAGNPATPATFSAGHMPPNTRVLEANLPAVKAGGAAGTLPTPPPAPLSSAPSAVTPSPAPKEGGGKLVLAPPKKKKAAGIVLAPPSSSKTTGTRSARASKRIRVQLSNMKKRITTAKIIHKDSKEKSIEEIRKLLEEAKLVKPASSGKKVPEEMLRSIYRDYLILRSKAL